jgi:hypothetical protein
MSLFCGKKKIEFVSEGASSMIGKNNGVAEKLEKQHEII